MANERGRGNRRGEQRRGISEANRENKGERGIEIRVFRHVFIRREACHRVLCVYLSLLSCMTHTVYISAYENLSFENSCLLEVLSFNPFAVLSRSFFQDLPSPLFFRAKKNSRQPVLRRTLSSVAVRFTKSSRYLPNYYLRLSHCTRIYALNFEIDTYNYRRWSLLSSFQSIDFLTHRQIISIILLKKLSC